MFNTDLNQRPDLLKLPGSVEFQEYGKTPRFNREVCVTEKIDGTNAGIRIYPREWMEQAMRDFHGYPEHPFVMYHDNKAVMVQSRNRFICPNDVMAKRDNYGFAGWVRDNLEQIGWLGFGLHFGEWWGLGIGRGYGLDHKRFSLFNASRHRDPAKRPSCCDCVPVLAYEPNFDHVNYWLQWLRDNGSKASPGFMKPEGIIVYSTAAKIMFKATLEKDHEHKGQHGNEEPITDS